MEITKVRLGQKVWFEAFGEATSGIVIEMDGLEDTVTVELDWGETLAYDPRDISVTKEEIVKLMDDKHKAEVLRIANELMSQTNGNKEQIYLNIIGTLTAPLEESMFLPDRKNVLASIKYVLNLVEEK